MAFGNLFDLYATPPGFSKGKQHAGRLLSWGLKDGQFRFMASIGAFNMALGLPTRATACDALWAGTLTTYTRFTTTFDVFLGFTRIRSNGWEKRRSSRQDIMYSNNRGGARTRSGAI